MTGDPYMPDSVPISSEALFHLRSAVSVVTIKDVSFTNTFSLKLTG
jgi:hypothetical protein